MDGSPADPSAELLAGHISGTLNRRKTASEFF
jgi:hypothetical protein